MTEEKRKIDIDTNKQASRRGMLKKTAIGIPAIMTLAHRPAFGAICTISGFQSVNPSGVRRTPGPGCGGNSPGGWKNPDVGQGGSDGSRTEWISAGFYPNPRAGQTPADNAGTTFYSQFMRVPQLKFGVGSSTTTMHDVLLDSPGTLESHAVANLLNAGFVTGYRLIPADVIGLYQAAVDGSPTYTTVANGTVVNMIGLDLQKFFDQYH